MSSSNGKVCVNCKPTEKDPSIGVCHIEVVSDTKNNQKDCIADYKKMEECMAINHGSISSCRLEWNNFRTCFNSVKK